MRLHRSGLHGRRGKSNTFDYVQASPGPAPLPMVQYRYISVVALCTVCIDLYGYVQTARPRGSLLSPGSPSWRCRPTTGQPWGTGGAAGRTPRPGTVSAEGAAHPAASLRTWPQSAGGMGGESSRIGACHDPCPAGQLCRRLSGQGVVVPRWFPAGSHEGQQVGGAALGRAALAGPPRAPGATRPTAS